MKQILLLFCLLGSLHLQAQITGISTSPGNFFDPEKDPVAFRSDTSLQLVVSEYVLAKSAKARMGQDCQILKTYKSRASNGAPVLVFEGIYVSKKQRFMLGIPLLPDAQGRFFYASAQALVCSSPGCNNCSILNGNCVGCCSNSTSSSVALPGPLKKIQTSIDE